ncbi:MAG: hypothetical protein WBL25_06565 [Anaerolineales bacterium]
MSEKWKPQWRLPAGIHPTSGATKPVPFEGTQKFEAQDGGTQMTLTAQAELGGFFKLAKGLVGKQLEKQMETMLVALKTLLKAG